MNKRISDEDMAKVSGGHMEKPTGLTDDWYLEEGTCDTCGMPVEAGAKTCPYCNDPIIEPDPPYPW